MSYLPPPLLIQRYPLLAKRLQKVTPQAGPVFDPRLAALWAQGHTRAAAPNTLYLVSGWGPHVGALAARIDASSLIVVYEASLPRLAAALQPHESLALLGDSRVHLFAGPVDARDFEQLHELPAARIAQVLPLRFTPSWQQDEVAYGGFFAEFARQFEVTRRLHLTNFNDSFFWQATTLHNLRDHAQAPDVAALKDLFAGLPVILVGAGPSLDEADAFLQRAQGRAVIIAVNSSFRKLRRLGIEPHLVLAADPRHDTARGFEGVPLGDRTYLIAPFMVNPRVAQSFRGRAFSWSGDNNALVALLRRRLGLRPGTSITERGTVSVAVADVALLLGASTLILVGQDMAVRPDGQMHVTDSFYAGYKIPSLFLKNSSESKEGVLRQVPGNTYELVPTVNNLFTYLKIFEQWVQDCPQLHVVNTARLGAKIAGVPYMTYDEADRLLAPLSFNATERLAQAHQSAPEVALSPQQWFQALQPTLSYAHKLYITALRSAVAIEGLPQRYWQMSYKDHREVREISELAQAINTLLEASPLDYQVVLEGYLKKCLLQYQAKVATREGENPLADELNRNREFFWALVEGIEPFLSLAQEKMPKELAPAEV